MSQEYKEFYREIGYEFKNESLLQTVLTHRSYLNEHRNLKLEHNERLEFLGDAVLELIVTEHLYRHYPNPEGELTSWRSALVRGTSLANVARHINLDNYMKMSRGEARSNGKSRSLILANALEALIGAIYLDSGASGAEKFINKYIVVELENIIKEGLYRDAKSALQEIVQEQEGLTPNYEVVSESGPDHDKTFISCVKAGERELSRGEGSSKQAAEQDAAQKALHILESE
jgi:ribonuclease-3